MGLSLTSTTVLPGEVFDCCCYPEIDPQDHNDYCVRTICSNISYGRFASFRRDVAEALNIDPYSTTSRVWFWQQPVTRERLRGERSFFLHSDSEGDWLSWECGDVAHLLRAYLASGRANGDHARTATWLVAALSAVYADGGKVIFG